MRITAFGIQLFVHLCHAGKHSEQACSSKGKVTSLLADGESASAGSLLQFSTATRASLHKQATAAAPSETSPDLLSLLMAAAPRAAGLNYINPGPSGLIIGLVFFFTGVMALLAIGHFLQLDQVSAFQLRNARLHLMQRKLGARQSESSTTLSTRQQLSSQQTMFSAGRLTQDLTQSEALRGPYSQKSLSTTNRADAQRSSEGPASQNLLHRGSLVPIVSLFPKSSSMDRSPSPERQVARDDVYGGPSPRATSPDLGPRRPSTSPGTLNALRSAVARALNQPQLASAPELTIAGDPSESSRHLCPGCVVPRGQECLLLVPEVQSVALCQCSHIVDLDGQEVMRVEVSIPQRTRSGLDQSPAVFLQSVQLHPAGKRMQVFCKIESRAEQGQFRLKMYIYNGLGDLYATLARSTEDSGLRYVLSSIGANLQMYFKGDFMGSALKVLSDSQEVLAETLPVMNGQIPASSVATGGPAYSPYRYQLKVCSHVDASLMIASLMSIQLMELVAARDSI
mmetsp:Transcript_151385/g.263892  ORF Transcript_151385/g.263892 Transcript_151385/m.263892 type:complete len:511 (+) Transcript_151385:101-1633(+)